VSGGVLLGDALPVIPRGDQATFKIGNFDPITKHVFKLRPNQRYTQRWPAPNFDPIKKCVLKFGPNQKLVFAMGPHMPNLVFLIY
jgi:hypothetical protein